MTLTCSNVYVSFVLYGVSVCDVATGQRLLGHVTHLAPCFVKSSFQDPFMLHGLCRSHAERRIPSRIRGIKIGVPELVSCEQEENKVTYVKHLRRKSRNTGSVLRTAVLRSFELGLLLRPLLLVIQRGFPLESK